MQEWWKTKGLSDKEQIKTNKGKEKKTINTFKTIKTKGKNVNQSHKDGFISSAAPMTKDFIFLF